MPAYRTRPCQLQHQLVIEWGQDGASTSAGTSPIDSADTERSHNELSAEDALDHPSGRAGAVTGGSWARLFDEAKPTSTSAAVRSSSSNRGTSSGTGLGAAAKAKDQPMVTTPHTCRSRIPRPCKFMRRCRDITNCSYCHDEAAHSRCSDRSSSSCSLPGLATLPVKSERDQERSVLPLRPEQLTIDGHICRSRIPRPCRFMQRCREPERCDYCHDHEAHSGKQTAKSWARGLHAAARPHANKSESRRLPEDESGAKFFPRLLDSEV